jgi:hypothetical protein
VTARSVNSMACRTILPTLKPDVILVIGTRIIGRQTLAGITAPVINFHSGINPKYPSRQFYHPTLWFYLWTAGTKGVW